MKRNGQTLMPDVCPVCGLPEEVCPCDEIVQEQQKIKVVSERRSHGKIVTIVEGLEKDEQGLEKTASRFKESLACGGTVKEERIELQGSTDPEWRIC